jgi:sulfoxide reductase heme-binding subunit YedZ
MHLTTSPIDWYAARAGGIVAYVLLTLGILLGLTMSTRRRSARWPRVAVEDVHRFTGLLTGTFVALHVVTIAIDAYLPFSLSSLVVPFTSRYRPAWVGVGIVAAELLLALAVTNRLRTTRRLGHRAWRRAHYLNFGVWAAATAHGLGSGTDRGAAWMLAVYAVAIGAVTAGTAWRVLRVRRVARPALVAIPALLAGVGSLTAVALGTGPLHPTPAPWNAARFDEAFQGRIVRHLARTRGIVSVAGQGTGRQHVLVRADLLVAPQRLVSTAFQMEYLPSGDACRGTVTRVDQDGLGFEARCRMGSGRPRTVAARWTISGPGADVGQGDTTLDGTLTSDEA